MRCFTVFVLLSLHSKLLFACHFTDIDFVADYSTARLGQCEQLSANQFKLTILPENEPVNPSPWFNFKITGKQARTITLELNFNNNYPRYLPKISHDGEHWQALTFTTAGKNMLINVAVSSQAVWIAAQEPVDNQAYASWLAQMSVMDPQVKVERLGLSAEQRPIDSLIRKSPEKKEWLVVIGRQHPPEVTGAMALCTFVETLLADTASAARFKQRFNLLVVPDLNPDGVASGNWRHTSKGKDLNRDWSEFSQPESRLVRDKLASLVKQGDNIVFAVDFHSTYHDVFYTMPASKDIYPPDLITKWLDGLNKRTRWIANPSVKPGTNPDSGVFKQFIADTYHVHAVTYEVGDNTPREKIAYVAHEAAEELITQFLNYPAAAFMAPAASTVQH